MAKNLIEEHFGSSKEGLVGPVALLYDEVDAKLFQSHLELWEAIEDLREELSDD